ncbi:Ionotropic receptor 137 [Frankliniella occidentalis]|nr:Ionotropic receptor 137 [Frankliniella occidentalis]
MEMLAVLALLLCPMGYDAVLPGPRPAPDTQGVGDLVTSFLSGSKGGVFVSGKSRALGTFLGQLPPETPRSLVLSKNTTGFQRLLLDLVSTEDMILITGDTATEMANAIASTFLPGLSRILLWTWAPSAEAALAHPMPTSVWLFGKQTALAVSTPDGGTTLFTLQAPVAVNRTRADGTYTVAEVDNWSPRVGRWLRRAAPFTKLCSTWRGGEPRLLQAFRPALFVANTKPYADFVSTIAHALRLRLEWLDEEDDHTLRRLLNTSLNCTLPAVLSFRSLPLVRRQSMRNGFLFFSAVQVVVPAGMDPHATLLQAVTNEFSPWLWCATAITLLGVALATALATVAVLGRPLASALANAPLQTLAPLLVQAPPGRTAHRPLSAVWLLMSVVLAAAYQGLLLRELTTPPGEINSLEQLEQSRLDIQMNYELLSYASAILPESVRSRVRYIPPQKLASAVRTAAEERSTAVILQMGLASRLLVSSYQAARPKKLHSFRVGVPYLSARVGYTAGWPLRGRLERFAQLIGEHGLYQQLDNAMAVHNRVNLHPTCEEVNEGGLTRALSLRQLRPAFLLLAYCYGVSAAVLVCEIIYHKWFDRRGRELVSVHSTTMVQQI